MPSGLRLADHVSCGTVIAAQARDAVLAQARAIEAAGFDSLWVGDHIAFHVPIMESLTLLSFVAGVTERVRLGTSVYLLPLRHPTTTAKVAATLDVLSGGRLTLGIGVGGEFPAEFEACGVPVEERGPRTDEAIGLLRRLWSERAVSHDGRFHRFGPVDIAPGPLQQGGPRIVVGGRKAPSLRRAGQLGDGYISHMCSPEQFGANVETISRHAAKAGRGEVPFETICFAFTVMDDDYESAAARAGRGLSAIYGMPMHDAAKRYCLLGGPADILSRMQDFARAGARHFVFSLLSDPAAFHAAHRDVIAPGLAGIEIG